MPPKQTHKESRPEKMQTPEHKALFEALESSFSISGTLLESRKLSSNNLMLGGSSYWLRWLTYPSEKKKMPVGMIIPNTLW